MRVLVIEDDAALLQIVRSAFESEAYRTDGADNGEDGYAQASRAIHDLIVLDVMLPGLSGFDIMRKLREQALLVPIILLTAKDAVEDRVGGLDAGADDYVVKPFAVAELLARARAVLRRRGTLGLEGELACGSVRLVPAARDAVVGGTPLQLTATEYELLEYLICHQDQILTREQIVSRVWGLHSAVGASAVDVYVHHLRRKLSAHKADAMLRTVRGAGYMLQGKARVR
ncbi:response regulator transcription factor [Paenibacillus sp. MWE-103]|uniref:Response regulator transcription factor n=1 Tax=Paenibacillus artemisiicola TaxID=1172618 RepID=A0ABS3W3E8_9BACL|nr:response regulator transcription factor [Paenibacillus artemisiicola]MBO7742829.1 response regulator transcription factor [Paenibacillus artemisiicola]